MKYKLLKDLLWLKAGEIVETSKNDQNGESIVYNNLLLQKNELDELNSIEQAVCVIPRLYPDFFEPISEEDEKIEEAKKLLEKAGAKVSWPSEEMELIDFLNQKVDDMFPFLPVKFKKAVCPCISMGSHEVCPHK